MTLFCCCLLIAKKNWRHSGPSHLGKYNYSSKAVWAAQDPKKKKRQNQCWVRPREAFRSTHSWNWKVTYAEPISAFLFGGKGPPVKRFRIIRHIDLQIVTSTSCDGVPAAVVVHSDETMTLWGCVGDPFLCGHLLEHMFQGVVIGAL